MGQKFYVAVSYGRTPDEAFAEALLDAIEGGFDDIYSGTIGPKDSYRPDAGFSGDPNNAEEVAWRIADLERTDVDDAEMPGGKWGPALCIELGRGCPVDDLMIFLDAYEPYTVNRYRFGEHIDYKPYVFFGSSAY